MGRSTVALVVAAVLAVAPAAAGAPTQTPKRGGTAVIGVPAIAEPACFNMFIVRCYAPSTFGIGIVEDLIFTRPFSTRPDLTFRADLASRVTLTRKPYTITYHIRPEARWSDGRPVTARDWAFAHGAFLESEITRVCCSDSWFVRSVTRWQPLDEKTIRMWVRSPVALPLVKQIGRAGLPPRHVIAAVDRSSPSFWRETVVNPKTGEPIASGPFLMHSRERGRQITFRRNRAFWGAHTAYLDRLVFRFLPPNELAGALSRGEIDLIQPFVVSDAAVEEIRQSRPPGIRVASGPSTFWEALQIRVGSGGHPALENKLARQALAYGLDRTRLARTLEQQVFGRTTPRLAPLESVVHLSQSPHYEPNWKRYRHRPALARRLLAQAGCRLGSDGIQVCAGERLSLRVGTTGGVDRRLRTLDILHAQLAEIGVEVRPQFFSSIAAATQAFERGDLDLGLWAWNYGIDTLRGPAELFGCGSRNPTGHCSRLVTRELDNADRVLDEESRARALNRADRLLAQAVPTLPLYQVPAYVAHRTTLRIPNLDPNDPLWNAEDWWLDD